MEAHIWETAREVQSARLGWCNRNVHEFVLKLVFLWAVNFLESMFWFAFALFSRRLDFFRLPNNKSTAWIFKFIEAILLRWIFVLITHKNCQIGFFYLSAPWTRSLSSYRLLFCSDCKPTWSSIWLADLRIINMNSQRAFLPFYINFAYDFAVFNYVDFKLRAFCASIFWQSRPNLQDFLALSSNGIIAFVLNKSELFSGLH